MNIIPTKNHLLIRMHDMSAPKSGLVLPEKSSPMVPYGEVVLAGPDCTFCGVGEYVLFLPGNMIAGFDKKVDPRFIVPETCVFAKYIPEPSE